MGKEHSDLINAASRALQGSRTYRGSLQDLFLFILCVNCWFEWELLVSGRSQKDYQHTRSFKFKADCPWFNREGHQ